MGTPIRDHQRSLDCQSEAIRGAIRRAISEAIREAIREAINDDDGYQCTCSSASVVIASRTACTAGGLRAFDKKDSISPRSSSLICGRSSCGAGVINGDERSPTQRSSEVIRGHQRPSEVIEFIRGHQGPSEAIRGHQRSSEAIRGHQGPSEAIRGHQRPSEVIRGHQRPSEVIRGHQRPSEVIRGHQRSSEAISGHQRSSEVIRGHQRSSPAGRAHVTARGASREVEREPSRPNELSCTCRGRWCGRRRGRVHASLHAPAAIILHQSGPRTASGAIRRNQARARRNQTRAHRNQTRARRIQTSLHVERLARLHTARTSAPLPSVRR